MRRLVIICLLFLSIPALSQDSSTWVRAFPITDYMLDLNDSVKMVQVQLPDDLQLKEKQMGLIRGLYINQHGDTVTKGYGRCQLIKGNYYYFSIGKNESKQPLKAGDLLYTMVPKTDLFYGRIPNLAGHFIRLTDVQEIPFYDRFEVFRYWSAEMENKILDSMIADIRYTGNYFLEEAPEMNQPVSSGSFKGKKLLELMKACQKSWLLDFFDYIQARPRLYAGRDWKLSEIFATWLSAGAPAVVKISD